MSVHGASLISVGTSYIFNQKVDYGYRDNNYILHVRMYVDVPIDFSILTLLFRVSEKVATPTSVVLMAIVSVVGSYWRVFVVRTVALETWNNFAVCVPVVCIVAPVGATLSSHFHRLVLAWIIYIIDILALVSAYAVVPMTTGLIVISVVIIVVGSIFFFYITKLGERLVAIASDENEPAPMMEITKI